MKTLVALSALAAIALAAPALEGEGIAIKQVPEWYSQAHPSLPELLKRERKSPLDQTTTVLDTGAHTESHIDVDASLMGRSLSLKKPVIVKTKHGLRLFRDSEEEKANANSHETCGRQVKVKLCDEDGKLREMLRESGHEVSNIQTPEDDMKQSIMMAKEAVEHLQRDLRKMEHRNAGMKMAQESDDDLHQDIEVARKALEHIHQNFGDLDTVSIHATTMKDSEATQDVHFTMARSEEAKMAQWKEAMNNIERNLEIVRNIEDSFKDAEIQESLLPLDQSESATTKHAAEIASHLAATEDHHLRHAETTQLAKELAEQEKNTEHILHEATIEDLKHHAREEDHTEDDMKPSASEALEMKTVDIVNHHTLRSENHRNHEQVKSAEEKIVEHATSEGHNVALKGIENIKEHHYLSRSSEPVHVLTLVEQQLPFMKDDKVQQLPFMKEAAEQTEQKLDTHKSSSDKQIATTMIGEHARTIESKILSEKPEHHLKHETNLEDTEKLTGFHAKSVEHLDEEQKQKIHEDLLLNTAMGKSAEKVKLADGVKTLEIKPKEVSQSSLKEIGDQEKKEHSAKPAHETHIQKLNNIAEQTENFMKAAEHKFHEQHKHQKIDYNDSDHAAALTDIQSADAHLRHHLAAMKSTEDHHHHHHLKTKEDHIHHSDMDAHRAHEHRHIASMKAAEDLRKDFHGMDHMRDSYMSEHHFIPSKMGPSHNYEMSEHMHPHFHGPSRFHHNMMPHGNMHDMSGFPRDVHPSKFHSHMRDAMEGLGSEHTFRWKPSQEARNAYGGSSLSGSISSSGGAVGVFPNANTGGCGIPLLLSCSPSVVSGSLAKAHQASSQASYSAPSYRAEEDFTFHNKRDTTKTAEARSTNVLRNPTLHKHKMETEKL